MTDITKGNLKRVFSWPCRLAVMFLQMLVGVVDLAMVGRVGPAAISAVGMSNQVFILSTALLNAFTVESRPWWPGWWGRASLIRPGLCPPIPGGDLCGGLGYWRRSVLGAGIS